MELYTLNPVPSDWEGNGCGPEGWKGLLIPDTLGGIDISEACRRHDYDHFIGGSEEDRQKSNMNFFCNMVIIIRRDDTWLTNEDIALKWAIQYYIAVDDNGKEYWNYK